MLFLLFVLMAWSKPNQSQSEQMEMKTDLWSHTQTSDWLQHVEDLTWLTTEETHKLKQMWWKCKSSVRFILNATAIKHSCCIRWVATVTFAEEMPPQSCSHTFDVLGAMENNWTTACRGWLPWKCIRPRSRERLSVHFEAPLAVTLSRITHDSILHPQIKTQQLFALFSWVT